jgi:hypothetical protein
VLYTGRNLRSSHYAYVARQCVRVGPHSDGPARDTKQRAFFGRLTNPSEEPRRATYATAIRAEKTGGFSRHLFETHVRPLGRDSRPEPRRIAVTAPGACWRAAGPCQVHLGLRAPRWRFRATHPMLPRGKPTAASSTVIDIYHA